MSTEEPSRQVPRRTSASALLFVAIVSAALGGGAVFLFLHEPPGGVTAPEETEEKPEPKKEPKKELYICPMHPQIVQDHPGDCPICGMDLVKAQKGSASAADAPGLSTVDIDPARQQLIGMQTVEATMGKVGGAWRTTGRIAIDETRIQHVNVKVPGFIEHAHGDFVGKTVKKGEPLFSLYSPELLAAQEEYVLAMKTNKALSGAGNTTSDGDVLVKAARRKLALWDIPDAELERLERTGEVKKTLTFVSPTTGVITKKEVVSGMRIEAGAMPYEIVDLSKVWVLADVYESELRFVKSGMAATLTLKAFPNRQFNGRVLFVDPMLDPQTRTVKVRLEFPNAAGDLRPEMFGEVVLHGQARTVLTIPVDAVVDSGTEKIVFVAIEDGRFQPRVIRAGDSDGKNLEVVSGLMAGEKVVTRANFLVDSESKLRASLAGLAAAASQPATTGGKP